MKLIPNIQNLGDVISMIGSNKSISFLCYATLIDLNGNQVGQRNIVCVEVSITETNLNFDLLSDTVFTATKRVTITRVAFTYEGKEILSMIVKYNLMPSETLTLQGSKSKRNPNFRDSTGKPLELPTEQDEVQTEQVYGKVKDLNDLPDVDDWPEYFPGKWMSEE